MKTVHSIIFAALISTSAFFFAGCKDLCKNVNCQHGGTCDKGNCTCPTGYGGSYCETEVRTTYVGTYKGNGTDNSGNPYDNYSLVFNTNGTSITSMSLQVLDGSDTKKWDLNVTLTSNNTFQIVSTTTGSDTYTGSGNLSTTVASLTLVRTPLIGSAVTYTFNNMTKQ